MDQAKTKLIMVAFLALLLGGMSAPNFVCGAEATLAEVVYITRSQACGCSAKSVKAADAAIARAFVGPRQGLLKRIDYDTERQAAVPYIGEYHLIRLPALIFLDGQKRLLWMTVGEVAPETINAKLSQFGG